MDEKREAAAAGRIEIPVRGMHAYACISLHQTIHACIPALQVKTLAELRQRKACIRMYILHACIHTLQVKTLAELRQRALAAHTKLRPGGRAAGAPTAAPAEREEQVWNT